MKFEKLPATNEVDAKIKDLVSADVLKEAFVCISIPAVVFAFTYLTLTAMMRVFFG